VEYFKNILDILINSFALSYNSRLDTYIEKIVELNPFELLINYFEEFEFNNIYQRLFEDIIILLLNKQVPEKLMKCFFIDNDYVSKFVDYSVNNSLFKFR
jgi:hypothetical protein